MSQEISQTSRVLSYRSCRTRPMTEYPCLLRQDYVELPLRVLTLVILDMQVVPKYCQQCQMEGGERMMILNFDIFLHH
jgi:hypothetical protein